MNHLHHHESAVDRGLSDTSLSRLPEVAIAPRGSLSEQHGALSTLAGLEIGSGLRTGNSTLSKKVDAHLLPMYRRPFPGGGMHTRTARRWWSPAARRMASDSVARAARPARSLRKARAAWRPMAAGVGAGQKLGALFSQTMVVSGKKIPITRFSEV
jgi:hypothetical protein